MAFPSTKGKQRRSRPQVRSLLKERVRAVSKAVTDVDLDDVLEMRVRDRETLCDLVEPKVARNKSGKRSTAVKAMARRDVPAEKTLSNNRRQQSKLTIRIAPPKAPKPPKVPPAVKNRLKAEQTVQLGNGLRLEIGGMRDEHGERYVFCREGKRFALTNYRDWHGGSGDASATMRRHGLVVVGSMGAVREAVDQLKHFPGVSIVTKSGWSKYGFALPDGRVLGPADQPEPLSTFVPVSGMLGRAGSLKNWKELVARPLADHFLAAFFMMMMFAAPLLRLTNRSDNFGFELFGEAGRGKSTLQALIASAAGPAIGGGDDMYWRTMNTTMNALESVMPYFDDLPLILDEAGLVKGSGNADARAQTMRELAFRLSAGTVRHRFGEPSGPIWRLVYLLSTNVSIASFETSHPAESEAIADRLLTIPLLPDRTHGIFDSCPPSYPSSGAFADALKQAAAENYGHALPAFLDFCARLLHEQPTEARSRIQALITEFTERSGANANDGSQKRVAEAFGLVYAAGVLAKEARVLPQKYSPARSAMAAYRVHRGHGRAPVSFDDRLRTLMRHSSTIDLTKAELSTLSAEQVASCPAFIFANKSGQRELLVPIEHVDTVFPGWKGAVRDPQVARRLKKSSDRLTRDRLIGPDGAKRTVYCFNVIDLTA